MRFFLPLLLSLAACRHKPPPQPETDGGELDPARTLQVAVVVPGQIAENRPATVQITGAGFERGATVSAGGGPPVPATVLDGNTLSVALPGLAAGVLDVTVLNPNGDEATLRGGLTVGGDANYGSSAECASVTVTFALDQAALTEAARATLTSRLPCWTGGEGPLTVEGHADERGTTDYNLALGNRRAEAVRAFLAGAGVANGRTRAVSWGEERPVDPGHSEAAWAANRRAVIVPGR